MNERMLSGPDVRAVVTAYLDAVASGSAEAVAALYAPDATVEDPVGSVVRRGRDAIEEFDRALAGSDVSTELLAVRVCGLHAAFSFRVTTRLDGKAYVVEPIDVMSFDADGAITTMRAFWGPGDMTVR